MRSSLFATALLTAPLLGVLGCKAEAFGAGDVDLDPATIEIDGLRLPGSELTIRLPGVSQDPTLRIILIDGSITVPAAWSAERPGDLVLRLPTELAGGRHTLALVRPEGEKLPLGEIQVRGFTEVRYAEGVLRGTAQPLHYLPGIVGFNGNGTTCGWAVALLDARSARIRSIPGTDVCTNFGLGTSSVPEAFTVALQDDKADWHRAGLHGGAMWTDSLQLWGGSGIVHELAPGIYLDAAKHWTDLWGPGVTDGGISLSPVYRSPEHVAFSADLRWAVPDHENSGQGILIVDRLAGTHHWAAGWLSARTDVRPDGTIVAFGLTTVEATPIGSRYRLGLIDPATGVTTTSVAIDTMPTYWDFWTAGRIYALGSLDLIVLVRPMGDRWELSLRDPKDLREVGRTLSPPVSEVCTRLGEPWLIEDPALHRMYLTSDDCLNTPVMTFVLPE